MPSIDPDKVAAALAEVAAAEVMPRFRNLSKSDIRRKAGNETVTVADEAAEAALARLLADLLPGSVVVGEESAAADPGVLARLAEQAPVWVIDPVDGTRNFAAGRTDFGLMAALVRGHQTVAGWIHLPVEGVTYMAELGGGAWRDGTRLGTPVAPGGTAALRGTIRFGFFAESERETLRAKARAGLGVMESPFCAAREYTDIAEGRQHFALFRTIKPWDHLPGTLIVNEAGGRAVKWDGSPYRSTDEAGGILAAATAEAWQEVRDFLGAA